MLFWQPEKATVIEKTLNFLNRREHQITFIGSEGTTHCESSQRTSSEGDGTYSGTSRNRVLTCLLNRFHFSRKRDDKEWPVCVFIKKNTGKAPLLSPRYL